MKHIGMFLLIALSFLSAGAQERFLRNLPDIPGYQTLICDFHMHSVFSDGSVWPSVRVDEAWLEGLDAIALTDHLEYRPHNKDISADFNRSWELARQYAKNRDVIVIAGTEITKGMPPGHFNALFIKDANAILNDDYKESIKEATGQGAFIIWNHPGWKSQQPDTMRWWDEHTFLLKEGWLHGIEVANEHEFYPEAINWARDKSLTFFASSDVHSPINMSFDIIEGHRPCTLVFAAERSEGGIREALFNGRTLAYFGNLLFGKQELLSAFLHETLYLKENEDAHHLSFINTSEIVLNLKLNNKIYGDWNRSVTVKPMHEVKFILPPESKTDEILVTISNFYTGAEQNLAVPLSSIKTMHH